jgi:hypothetical protein
LLVVLSSSVVDMIVMPIACFCELRAELLSTTHRRDEFGVLNLRQFVRCVTHHVCVDFEKCRRPGRPTKNQHERRLELMNATLHSAEKKEATSLHSCVSLANLPLW